MPSTSSLLRGKTFATYLLRSANTSFEQLSRETGERLLYCDHVELAGEEFFWLACQRDVEGIVAKRRFDPYLVDGSVSWYKIRNREYSQWVGREELFGRERETDPEFAIWNSCAKVCDIAQQLIDAY
jgi:hypothetical protein